MLNILGKRYLFFGISLLIILPGIIIMALSGGLPLSIDFTGGSLLEISFDSGKAPSTEDVIAVYNDLGIDDLTVKTAGDDILIIQSPFIQEEVKADIINAMEEKFNDTVTIRNFSSVGPTVGKEVANRALLAVAVAALGVIIYVTFAFRGIKNAFRYGVCAILAMVHDVLMVLSITVIGSKLFGWQFDSLTLTAVLTVIGFSVQDKIVVFDRIRENSNIYRRLDFEKLVNHSIVQTLSRSINTQLMTSEFLLLSLALIGGVTLQQFSVILLLGLLSGTYSSIFIAAPSLVIWENHEWKTWFGRNKTASA